MGTIERADELLATSTGQTAGWFLIFAIVLGFFSQAGSEVTFVGTVVALALSWILGTSYGRQQNRNDEDEQTE